MTYIEHHAYLDTFSSRRIKRADSGKPFKRLDAHAKRIEALAAYAEELMTTLNAVSKEVKMTLDEDRKTDQMELARIMSILGDQFVAARVLADKDGKGKQEFHGLNERVADIKGKYHATTFMLPDGYEMNGPNLVGTVCKMEDGMPQTAYHVYEGKICRHGKAVRWHSQMDCRLFSVAADPQLENGNFNHTPFKPECAFEENIESLPNNAICAVRNTEDGKRRKEARNSPEAFTGNAVGTVNFDGKLYREVIRVQRIMYEPFKNGTEPAFDIFSAKTIPGNETVFISRVLNRDHFDTDNWMDGEKFHNRVFLTLEEAINRCKEKAGANRYDRRGGFGCGNDPG